MLQKIRYRLCFNYANRLNKDGQAPVAVECRQGKRKMYVSSGITLSPEQWWNGQVINHDNASKLTAYLIRWRNSIEEIELDALLSGKNMTLRQLRDAVRTGVSQSAQIRDFMHAVIDGDSSRKPSTKQGYLYLVNDLEKEFGPLTLNDVDYDLIIRYRESQRRKGLSENTIKGRLKALRCLLEEARKRDLIDRNPFDKIVIGNIGGRQGGLTIEEVRRLDRLELTGKEEKVRDLFVVGCMTGLRWGDLSTLEEAEIKDGMLRKTMYKTHHEVVLPVSLLFKGKPLEIIRKYSDIKELSHCCHNTQANKIIKEIASMAKIKKRIFFHCARKTFGQMLNVMGMPMADISVMLGHRDVRTTRNHYVFNDTDRIKKSVKKLFKSDYC